MASNSHNSNGNNHLNQNNHFGNSSITINRIAHRTRSKCQLSDCSILELEKNLPDDLLGNLDVIQSIRKFYKVKLCFFFS
jgi:hypothetical protein